MKAGKIIEYLKQFDENDEIAIKINVEVFEPSLLEDVKLYDIRLAPDDEFAGEPLVFNTRPVRIKTID